MQRKRLKQLRQEKGISQTKMAFELGWSTQNYIEYERGNRVKMPKEIEQKISSILGIEYEYIREIEMNR